VRGVAWCALALACAAVIARTLRVSAKLTPTAAGGADPNTALSR
jgi:hypothetical protein